MMAFMNKPWIRLVITNVFPYTFAKSDQALADDHQDPQQPPTDAVSSHHTPFSSPNSFQPQPSVLPEFQSREVHVINPILKKWQELELGKSMLAAGIGLGVFLLNFGEKVGPKLCPAILLLLCLGITCLWTGALLGGTLPDKLASQVELFAAVCILLVFFTVIGSFLPFCLVWVLVLLFAVCLVPTGMSFSHAKAGVVNTDEVDIC